MPTQTRTQESIHEKAERIMADPGRARALLDNAPHAWVGVVRGDHADYSCFAFSEAYVSEHLSDLRLGGRVGCTCRAGRTPRLCSHALVAEALRTREER